MSVFLTIPAESWTAHNAHAFAIRDRFPVTPGHTLVITRRVVADWFSATEEGQRAVMDLVDVVKRQLDEELAPDGYNVGFNAGEAAGQTVMHLHVHVIPRRRGDVDLQGGAARFLGMRLHGTANGAVLAVKGAAETPGTALVFFDGRGRPTVVGGL